MPSTDVSGEGDSRNGGQDAALLVELAGRPTQAPVSSAAPFGSERGWWPARIAGAIVLPLACFLVLRPETYGLTPNRLDPFFYSGYAINFDDIMAVLGDSHYFVTRWTSYLPSRAATDLLGPHLGRLLLRWLLAATILLSIWHVGRQWRWSRPAELVIGVVVITTPIFARAFLTDYVEWVVVGALLLVVLQSFEPSRTWWRPLVIGALVAAAVISNPFSILACAAPVVVYLARAARPVGRALIDTALIAIGAAVLLIGGLLMFRWQYAIPNIYDPTLRFIDERSTARDPWKSPRLDWMLAYTWIYIPPLALAVGWIPRAMRRRVLTASGGLAVSVVLAVQYVLQWLDQFVRNGNGLEISYYWVFIYPSLALYLAFVLGRFAWRWTHASVFVAAWVTVLVIARAFDPDLPGGWAVPVTIALIALALITAGSRRPAWSSAVLVSVALVLQVNAPTYDPSSYYDVNSDPHYDDIYFRPRTDSVRAYEEAVWLEERLDTLPDDTDLFFVADPLYALAIVGIYAPHVTGRVVGLENGRISSPSRLDIDRGLVPRIAIFGPTEFVDAGLVALERVVQRRLLDDRNDDGFGYRLAVVELNTPATGPFSWRPVDLLSATGRTQDEARVASPSIDKPGYLIYGPYVRLDDRRYRITVDYGTDGAAGEPLAGKLEISRSLLTPQDERTDAVDLGIQQAADLAGASGGSQSLSVEFDGSSAGLWEFRVLWDGSVGIRVERISIQPVD